MRGNSKVNGREFNGLNGHTQNFLISTTDLESDSRMADANATPRPLESSNMSKNKVRNENSPAMMAQNTKANENLAVSHTHMYTYVY